MSKDRIRKRFDFVFFLFFIVDFEFLIRFEFWGNVEI